MPDAVPAPAESLSDRPPPALERSPLPAGVLSEAFAPYAEDDDTIAQRLLAGTSLAPEREERIDAVARELIGAVRAREARLGGIEDLLREYALTTREGLALMALAESLLRVPDAATADRLIEDKLAAGAFAEHAVRTGSMMAQASTWALGLTARLVHPGETPDHLLAGLVRRIGRPAVRTAARQAVRIMGAHFVLGESIGQALKRAEKVAGPARYSFDMLGEGARTPADARRYRDAYADAIAAVGASAGGRTFPDRPGISVKLSALHPRYEPLNRERVLADLVPVLVDLALQAREHDLLLTVDAEEADRLELSLDVFGATAADSSLAGWDGFGLAVQAYQKRAGAVIGHVADITAALRRRFTVRLVKGAYWDTEVKRAQERGLADYPVFTRKPMTDLAYMACAETLLAADALFPQFATHNALTIADVLERGRGRGPFEFQRLHGMGEDLYGRLSEIAPKVAQRVYAPVGSHRDLLAYLVRRLLENGANSSFVAATADPSVPVEDLLTRPARRIAGPQGARHPAIPLPRDLFAPWRFNSRGVEFGDRAAVEELLAEVKRAGKEPALAAPMGLARADAGGSASRQVLSPIDGTTVVGMVEEATAEDCEAAMRRALAAFPGWAATSADERARCLMQAADLIEARRARLIHLLQAEAGKTLDDAVAEVREAADFCRYYAVEGRRLFAAAEALPGPTGEANTLALHGRGTFVAISPWNFPLAIFTGQVAAALAAGNPVIAKPAEQTPLVAAEAVTLLLEAGVPAGVVQLLPGDGEVGAALIGHPRIAGVVFTGSTDTARTINRTLAAKDGPIVPLIAETGGINAMIVDATALPEQVSDDVLTSAFRSAGQRCSALRLLCVQEEIADDVIAMIAGAAGTLAVGDPRDPAIHVGPVIDAEAKARLDAYLARMAGEGRARRLGEVPVTGHFVAPHLVMLETPEALREEVFGPVLHVVRYRAAALDALLDAIAANGYALTLGIQSRISESVARIIARLPAGNVYVNRNMIGAVVGSQPFGGSGLSGTGPKAGGPHYLQRFAVERTVTVNEAAAGGNAGLLAMGD